jgi:hypothetical protein
MPPCELVNGAGTMRSILPAVVAALSLGGCASRSPEVSAADVSPIPYQSYTCQKLRMEAYALSAKATKLAGVQDEKRPEALLASGDGEVAAQLSQLKGQMNAIEQAIIDKKCAIQRSTPPATK